MPAVLNQVGAFEYPVHGAPCNRWRFLEECLELKAK